MLLTRTKRTKNFKNSSVVLCCIPLRCCRGCGAGVEVEVNTLVNKSVYANHPSNGVWWYKKANLVQMISVWAGSLGGFASCLPRSPRGHSSLLTCRNTRACTPARTQATVFPHSAAGVCLHLSYWLMKQAQRGVRERQKSRSRLRAASLAVTHTHTHLHARTHSHTLFHPLCHVLSVSVTADTVDTDSHDTQAYTHAHWETWHTAVLTHTSS